MTTRNRQPVILINGEPYYTAQKAQEDLSMTYSALRNQVIAGKIKSETPTWGKQKYYRGKDVDKMIREKQASEIIHHNKNKPSADKNKTSTKFIKVTTREQMIECQEISQELFGVGRDTVDERMLLVAKNPETYHFLEDENSKEIVGYIAIMPLKTGRLEKVLSQDIPVKIDAKDIETFDKPKKIDLYLHAIGVKPKFNAAEKHTYGARLVHGLMELIIELGEKGINIETITARSYTPDGIRLMKHAGFTEITPLSPGRRTFIVDVKNSGIPFIMQYKRALQQSLQKEKAQKPENE